MRIKTLFSTLLRNTYDASGGREPLERFYASMFSNYFEQQDTQPNCAAVQGILRGERLPPRKMLRFYRSEQNPRCPETLREDLEALLYCCFPEAGQCTRLRAALEAFLEWIPKEDADDLRQAVGSDDLVRLWTYLTWYALCGDHCG